MDVLPPELLKIVKSARLKHYPKGQIIYYQGDTLTNVFIIKSGVVKIYDIDDNGNEKILHIAKTPAVIPFSFFSGLHYLPKWFYATLTDCELYIVPAEELKQAMNKDSKLTIQLTNNFSRDAHELLVRLSSFGKSKAYVKLAATLRFLVVLHSVERSNSWFRITFPVNHQLLADITGITRERTAVIMKEFLDHKIIRNPKLNVLEVNRNRLIDRLHQHS